jgi:HPt (histidine-containing phosphotransfer) domain-containing protein
VPRVRIGIHTGEPLVSSEGYVGLDVHRAARIGDAANGGQVLVSESTRSLVGDGIALRDLGEYRLAGLDRPERLYQVVASGLPTEFEPPRAQPQVRHRGKRSLTPDEVRRIGWRVHGLGKVSPAALVPPLQDVAGAVLGAARVVAAADHTLIAVDRDELVARLADYQARSSAAPHVAQAAAELEQELAALDRLPERRLAVEESVSRLDDELESLELRLRNAPRAGPTPALREEFDELRSRLTDMVQLLEETNATAPPGAPDPHRPTPSHTQTRDLPRRRQLHRARGGRTRRQATQGCSVPRRSDPATRCPESRPTS